MLRTSITRYLQRKLESQLTKAARNFPAVVLTGPRRAGKTCLLRHLFPKASYHLFEDPDVVARFRHDPQGFLDDVRRPAVLDEMQNVPELFRFVRSRVDRAPRRTGQWILTGSREAGLMRNVSESMAGRAVVLQLWPLSAREISKVRLLRGGYPEVLAPPRAASLWFSSYLQTYLERDVRAVTAIHDLVAFRRFLALLASRHGQILNKSNLAEQSRLRKHNTVDYDIHRHRPKYLNLDRCAPARIMHCRVGQGRASHWRAGANPIHGEPHSAQPCAPDKVAAGPPW